MAMNNTKVKNDYKCLQQTRIIYKDSHWKILYEQGLKKIKRREQRSKVK